MTRTRRWMWTGGVVVALVAVWLTVSRSGPIDVELAAVSTGPMQVVIDETGTTRVRDHVDVSAPVGGRWVPLTLRAGDSIAQGTLLGSLYPAPLDLASQEQARARLGVAESGLREAEASVSSVQTALDDASRTLARAERLAAAGGVSPSEVEQARDAVARLRSALDAARARVRAATFEVSGARAVLTGSVGKRDAMRVTSPRDGMVLRVFEEHEHVVPAGTPLVAVGDPHDLEVVIPLLTADAVRVREGADVALTFGARGDTVRARVARVEPSAYTKLSALGVEEQRVDVIAAVPTTALVRGEQIGDGYRVHASVTVWSSPNVTRVAAGALVRDGDRWFAFVEQAGRVQRRPVVVGERSTDMVQVKDGLADGDMVVLYPSDMIADGIRVRARPTG